MRRALILLVLLSVLPLATSVLADDVSGEFENYKDKFDSGGYWGSNGSIHWGTPWTEVGESDGPSSGKVRVVGSGCQGQCLRIETGLLGLLGGGAQRLADTGEFVEGVLSYQVAFDGGGLLGLLNATLNVQATSNGGGSWSTVDSLTLGPDDDDLEHRSVSVGGFIGEGFGVRFLVTGALGASVIIDIVDVAGTVLPTTTTTSTTTTTTTTSTTTTTTPTTTTTKPTTTTTKPTTTTTKPTTTITKVTLPSTTLPPTTLPPTTIPRITLPDVTTTTDPDPDPTVPSSTDPNTRATTTTTDPQGNTTNRPTSTTEGPDSTPPLAAGGGGDSGSSGGDDGGSPDDTLSGFRPTEVGIGGDFEPGLFGSEGDFETGLFGSTPEVLAFEISPGYASAVELIQAGWYWVLALALLIAAALIKGIDRRFRPPPKPE